MNKKNHINPISLGFNNYCYSLDRIVMIYLNPDKGTQTNERTESKYSGKKCKRKIKRKGKSIAEMEKERKKSSETAVIIAANIIR